jgi:hypothetical protein
LAVAAGFVWLWSRRVLPIRGVVILGIGFGVLAFVIPMVQATRGLSGADRLDPSLYLVAASELDSPVVLAIAEMGATFGVTAETMELVPATRPFDLGSSYLYALLAVVPNVAWDLHPSVAHGTPSTWYIWAVDPGTAAVGGGRGYSFVAEAYFNFGSFAPLATLAFGFFLGTLWKWVERQPNEAKDAFLATYLVFLLPYVRADSMVVVRPLVWYAGLPYATASLILRRATRPARPWWRARPPA